MEILSYYCEYKIMKILIVIFGLCVTNGYAYVLEDLGPNVKASIGELWPKPKFAQKSDKFFEIDPNNFHFIVVGETCDILENATLRYLEIIKSSANSVIRNNANQVLKFEQNITNIFVNLTSECENLPHFKMDESYSIAGYGRIISNSIWGILRGLETYSQLITPSSNGMLQVPDIRIEDSPRFPHRGLLLDTSRHYITTNTIMTILDGMEYNKLNVFHWHIVDDESFPYESAKYPELSEKGAFMPSMIYTRTNISNVIEYARMRGIRVVVEFDVPAHTRSWGNSHPEILTKCGSPYSGKLGPINPINNATYEFLRNFFSEVREVFPDKYIHVGGDEVGFECWKSNEEIKNYIKKNAVTYLQIQKKFMERVTKIVQNKSLVPIVWQEAMVAHVKMPNETVVQVWLGDWKNLLDKYTKAGHRVLLSACWYLDQYSKPIKNWQQLYKCEPHGFLGSSQQKQLVIGGEACMWNEDTNSNNVLQIIFPRVSAVAERLWSQRRVINKTDAEQRLEEHTCRMILRGIPAKPPNGPGLC